MGGALLTFGASGNLRNSDLVMYDRQTEHWWQQFSGEAIVGDLTGTQLTFLPAAIIAWSDFKAQNPNGEVLFPGYWLQQELGCQSLCWI